MSSCFLCDCSYGFQSSDKRQVYYSDSGWDLKYFKQRPIIIGSAGYGDDQQHENSGKQNYISYRVKSLEFEFTIPSTVYPVTSSELHIPNYVLIVKIPYAASSSIFDFDSIGKFLLFRNPECVLAYEVLSIYRGFAGRIMRPRQYKININKPFIVSPTELVLVVYMFTEQVSISSSAKVWFDVV